MALHDSDKQNQSAERFCSPEMVFHKRTYCQQTSHPLSCQHVDTLLFMNKNMDDSLDYPS